MFTMANTISVATYTIGFAESMLDLLADIIPSWNGIVVPQDECAVAGCRDMDVRIIAAPCLGKLLFEIKQNFLSTTMMKFLFHRKKCGAALYFLSCMRIRL